MEDAAAAAAAWGIVDSQRLATNPSFQRLTAVQQRQLQSDALEMLYLLGSGKAQLAMRAQDETDRDRLFQEALLINQATETVVGSTDLPKAFLMQRARLLLQANRSEEAERLLARTDQPSAEQHDQRMLAYELGQQRRFREAASVLERQLSRSPHDPALWFCLGNAQLSLGLHAAAERSFSTAIAIQPDFALAREHRGAARLGVKDFQGAKADFDDVLQSHPQLTSVLVNRSLAFQGLGELERALQDLSLALERGASQTRIYFLRARIRQQMHDLAGAEADRQRGLQETPCDELSWVARGVARLPEDPSGALDDFRQALRLAPGSRTALQNTAHVLSERLGKNKEALEALDEILVMDPEDPATRASRGVLLARMGDREAAVRDAEQSLVSSDLPLIIYQAGCIYAQCSRVAPQDAERAIELIARALQHDARLVTIAVRDPDLSPLGEDAGFRKTLAAATQLVQAVDGE